MRRRVHQIGVMELCGPEIYQLEGVSGRVQTSKYTTSLDRHLTKHGMQEGFQIKTG